MPNPWIGPTKSNEVNMSEEAQLSPCPFCPEGGVIRGPHDWGSGGYRIYCGTCGSSLRHATAVGVEERWNRRPVEDALRTRCAALDAELRTRIVPGDIVEIVLPSEPPFVEGARALVTTVDLEDGGPLVCLLRIDAEDSLTGYYEDWVPVEAVRRLYWTAEEIEAARQRGDRLYASVFGERPGAGAGDE